MDWHRSKHSARSRHARTARTTLSAPTVRAARCNSTERPGPGAQPVARPACPMGTAEPESPCRGTLPGRARLGHGAAVWDYLPYGPYPDEAAFNAWLRTQAAAFERVWFTLRPQPDGTAAGMATYLDINPLDGVIEIGGMVRPGAATNARRDRGAVPAARPRHRRPWLSPHAMALQFAQREIAQRRSPARLSFRGRVLQPHDRKRPEPRHGVVFDSGRRMAGGPEDHPDVAC